MNPTPRVVVVIPALDEEASLGLVLDAIPRSVEAVVVCDNGSRDRTAEVARARGAIVVHEPQRGYGAACLRALEAVRQRPEGPPDVVCFLDADFSDYPEDLPRLIEPIASGDADLVLGSRMLLPEARAALLPQARFGNQLATCLIRLLWGARFTDLGPFRAIRWDVLEQVELRDPNYGWTVELQIKAARRGLRALEVPVRYRRRVGTSKITGTLRGTLGAGTKILTTIGRHGLFARG
ncbi:MAG: glycosyltransferase family 2 protein [Planctomycetes bacterium]|nr:glycosyltransferase family 2 protein [Planctomycetota bacterium]